jgi:hypothetical protein
MSSSYFQTLFRRQLLGFTRFLASEAVWVVPAGIGGAWLVWPALNFEWKMEMGLATSPDADMFRVQEEKQKRYEAKFGKKADAKDDDDEEAEEEEDTEEEEDKENPEEDEEEADQGESGAGGDDEEAGDKDDDADDEEEDEEEESAIVVPPLFVPSKGKLSKEQVWDNFTIKVRSLCVLLWDLCCTVL